jgi:hypothetical protein
MKILLKSLLVAMVLYAVAVSCTKDTPAEETPVLGETISSLAETAVGAFEDQEVLEDESTGTLYMVNDGIPADFLVDEKCMDTPPGDGEEGIDMSLVRERSFIRCLRGLSLDPAQQRQVRNDLQTYNDCKKQAIHRVRAIYSEVKATYHTKYQRLLNAFRSGNLTREAFRTKVAELRIAFKREINSLHLNEKLAEKLKGCLRGFFTALHEDLSERQWNAFVECYRNQ